MSSTKDPWWKRHFLYYVPGLFIKCPAGNLHWRWNKLCECDGEDEQYVYAMGKWWYVEARKRRLQGFTEREVSEGVRLLNEAARRFRQPGDPVTVNLPEALEGRSVRIQPSGGPVTVRLPVGHRLDVRPDPEAQREIARRAMEREIAERARESEYHAELARQYEIIARNLTGSTGPNDMTAGQPGATGYTPPIGDPEQVAQDHLHENSLDYYGGGWEYADPRHNAEIRRCDECLHYEEGRSPPCDLPGAYSPDQPTCVDGSRFVSPSPYRRRVEDTFPDDEAEEAAERLHPELEKRSLWDHLTGKEAPSARRVSFWDVFEGTGVLSIKRDISINGIYHRADAARQDLNWYGGVNWTMAEVRGKDLAIVEEGDVWKIVGFFENQGAGVRALPGANNAA